MDAFLTQLWIARWAIAQGLVLTLEISAAAVVFGTLLGFAVGILLVFGPKPGQLLVRAYVDVMRGTPVLVLILAAFYMPSVIGLSLTATQAGILALTLFAGAHIGELVRGALQAIPPGQSEAAKSIGLRFGKLCSMFCSRRRCAQFCRPGSTQGSNWSRAPPCCRSSASASFSSPLRKSSVATS